MATAAKTKSKVKPAAPGPGYLALIHAHPLRPIRSEAEMDAAVDVINGLIDRTASLTPDEVEYEIALAILIGFYEADHIPEPTCSPAGMLRNLLLNHDVSQTKLATDTGVSESTVSEILSGKRGISAKNRRIFAAYFKTDPAVFV